MAAAFVFGVASFANVPPMQMRVMKYGKAAPELAFGRTPVHPVAGARRRRESGLVSTHSKGSDAMTKISAKRDVIALSLMCLRSNRQTNGGSSTFQPKRRKFRYAGRRALFQRASIAARSAQRSRCMRSGRVSVTTKRCVRTRSPNSNLASKRSCKPSYPSVSHTDAS